MQMPEQRDEVEMLSLMLLIRRFEERASQQYQAQKIGGFCHLYIGQEAVIVGAVAATRHDDYLITAYRDHGHALARGTSADACMAERGHDMTQCIRLCLDCSDICEATARLAIRRTGDDTGVLIELLELCARMCDACAAECERHDHDHCRLCAQICRETASDCRRAAESLA